MKVQHCLANRKRTRGQPCVNIKKLKRIEDGIKKSSKTSPVLYIQDIPDIKYPQAKFDAKPKSKILEMYCLIQFNAAFGLITFMQVFDWFVYW